MSNGARQVFSVCTLAAVGYLGLIAAAPPTPTLPKVLAEIRQLDEASTVALVSWASYPNPSPPDMVLSALDQAEVDTLDLPPADRSAVLAWLSSGKRAALYARGLDDADIGPCIALIESKRCSANASTALPAGAAQAGPSGVPSKGGAPVANMVFPRFEIESPSGAQSGARITAGFAAMRIGDSGEEIHCISYANTASKAIAAVTFTYRVLTATGGVLTAGSDIASLTLAPGGVITAPADWAAYLAAAGPGPPSSCWTHPGLLSAAEARATAAVAISVSAVAYDDGSHWPP
jgi:hypothetical protein